MADKGKVLTLFFMDENLEGRIKCTIGGSKYLAYKISRSDIDLCKNIDKLKLNIKEIQLRAIGIMLLLLPQ